MSINRLKGHQEIVSSFLNTKQHLLFYFHVLKILFVWMLILPWLLFGMYTRDEIGSHVLIFKILGSGYFKRVISAFQSGITVTVSLIPHLQLFQFRSV